MPTVLTSLAAAGAALLLGACAGGVAPAALLPAAPASAISAISADDYYALGRQHYGAQHHAAARAAFQQALALAPQHGAARNGLAAVLAGQGELAAAITVWQQLVAEQGPHADGGSAYLLANLGYAYLLAGELTQAVAMLEKACLLDPLNPLGWEHLGRALQASGMGQRAETMWRQAATLRAHDVRQDLALAPPGPASASLARAAAQAGRDRTEVIQAGAALVQVRRVAAAGAIEAPLPAASAPPPLAHTALRIEISNGNGVRGMASQLARALQGPQRKVVRLSNLRPFVVLVSRIEYAPAQQDTARALSERLGLVPWVPQAAPQGRSEVRSDLRIVLGHDLRDAAAARKISQSLAAL